VERIREIRVYEWQRLGKVKQPVRIVLKNREAVRVRRVVGALAVTGRRGSAVPHHYDRSQ